MKHKKNIVIIVDDYHGGAGNIAQLLALELQKSNKVHLILTNLHSKPRYNMGEINYIDLPMSIMAKNKIAGLFNNIKRMKNVINSINPDFVISFLDNNNTFACLSLWNNKEIPVIVSERSNPVVILPKFPWNILRRIAYKRANLITVQFENFKRFEQGRFTDKCEVTSNIVKTPVVLKSDWNTEKMRFVTFGRLASIKRMDLMIDIFTEYAKNHSNSELHIWGDGSEKEALLSQIKNNNMEKNIFLMGYNKDVHYTLLQYDAYMMTSLQEGFPNSLCEAMAVGLPSIAFECHEGIAELMDNNQNGYVIPEGNTKEYIEKMNILTIDKAKREVMGRHAQKIVNRYNEDAVMKQWKNCINMAFNNK